MLRRHATDHVSLVSAHLMGTTQEKRQLGITGFGISCEAFATQAETLETHSPELAVARTAVRDGLKCRGRPQLFRSSSLARGDATLERSDVIFPKREPHTCAGTRPDSRARCSAFPGFTRLISP